ncbi:unnamed protein product [Ectocarpus sp. 8 AP-2014]
MSSTAPANVLSKTQVENPSQRRVKKKYLGQTSHSTQIQPGTGSRTNVFFHTKTPGSNTNNNNGRRTQIAHMLSNQLTPSAHNAGQPSNTKIAAISERNQQTIVGPQLLHPFHATLLGFS